MRRVRQITAAALAVVLTCMSGITGYAGALPPVCDETLYITLGGDGEIEESSIVKRYEVKEDGEIQDFGTYETISNLTTKAEPVAGTDGSYRFPVKAADGVFYFEGTTKTKKQELPWDIQVNYLLNGVEVPAESLAGQKGLVEIEVDLMPNKTVSDFYRNNMALTMTAMVNRDEVLSLRAEGAQIQTVGNMSAVVFFALPGEERHDTIAIGSDDFQFGGLIFLMVPLTLSQLDDVAELRDAKETLEDSKDAISDSMDVLCDTLDQMQSGIAGTAEGLRGIDSAREILHSGREQVYDEADQAVARLDELAQSLRPFQEHTNQAQSALGEIREDINDLVSDVNDLEPKLCDLKDTVRYLQDDVELLQEMLQSPQMEIMGNSFHQALQKTEQDLRAADSAQSGLSSQVEELLKVLGNLQTGSTTLEEEAENLEELDLEGMEELVLALQEEIPLVDDRNVDDSGRQASPSNLLPDDVMEGLGGILGTANGMAGDTALLQDVANLILLTDKLLVAVKSQKEIGNGALTETADLLDNIGTISNVAEDICADIDSLNQTLEQYHPEALQTLADLGSMTDRAAESVASLSSFFGTLENQVQSAGGPLNEGTKAALNGLADVLEHANSGLAQTDVLRSAKDTIFSTMDDKWDEFSEEHTTILNFDPDTETVSLTSGKNPAPRSMQIVVRTKEITKDDEAAEAVADETFHPEGNLFHRIGMIFKKIWNAIARFLF